MYCLFLTYLCLRGRCQQRTRGWTCWRRLRERTKDVYSFPNLSLAQGKVAAEDKRLDIWSRLRERTKDVYSFPNLSLSQGKMAAEDKRLDMLVEAEGEN